MVLYIHLEGVALSPDLNGFKDPRRTRLSEPFFFYSVDDFENRDLLTNYRPSFSSHLLLAFFIK